MASPSSGSRDDINAFTNQSKDITRELKRLNAMAQKANEGRRHSCFTEHEQLFACRFYLLADYVAQVPTMF